MLDSGEKIIGGTETLKLGAVKPVVGLSTLVPTARFPATLRPGAHVLVADQYFHALLVVFQLSSVTPGVQVAGSVAPLVVPTAVRASDIRESSVATATLEVAVDIVTAPRTALLAVGRA
jgi:hypothetical protein